MTQPDALMPRFFRFLRWTILLLLALGVFAVSAVAVLAYNTNQNLPDVQALRSIELQEPLYVYANDGRLIGLFGEMRRYPVQIADVPLHVKQAFLAAEDANFYKHHGIDIKGISRAFVLLAKTGGRERVAGGSTITQQVAKQFFLSSEYSFRRKFSEILLALKMERELSKDEIFELYLNKSFFGNRAYGIAAAAEFYYGKKLSELSLDEAATLAGIPKFPSSGNPISNPERAQMRRDNYTLQRMAELGFVTHAEAEAARKTPMHASPHEREVEVYAPYVAEMVRQQMIERYGDDVLNKGYHVTTTIDPDLQAAADKAVIDGLRIYDRRHGWRKPTQTVQIPVGATEEAIGKLLRDTPPQGGLLPAVVTDNTANRLHVVLADGSALDLAGSALAWTRKTAANLAQPGDVVRLRQLPNDTTVTAENNIRWELDQIPRAQAALVSLDADSGALKALIGGYSFAGNKFNRATQALRQPGSAFKPFVYAAAFERGFNPASIVLDAPVVFKDRRGHVWRPQNSTGTFAGPMRIREALVQSRNLVSVRMLDAIGVDFARRYISHFGFDEASLPPNLSMSLGTASLSPLSVARAYAAFNNGGFLITPWFIDQVRDRDGNDIFKESPAMACMSCAGISPAGTPATTTAQSTTVDGFNFGPAPSAQPSSKPTPKSDKTPSTGSPAANTSTPPTLMAERAIDPRIAWQLHSMMLDVVRRGTATAARALNRDDVGGKTGSTNDHKDAWFSGFGGNYSTVVWVGRDDSKSLGYREYGGQAALPIWINYMRQALTDNPLRLIEPPEGMIKVSVSADGRLLPLGTGGIEEWIKVEDLERMEEESYLEDEYSPEQSEAAFDIF